MKVPITKPYVGDEEINAIADVIRSGWLIQGSRVQEFERMFCEYTGARYAKACSSCTTALHMGLLATGIGNGDAVAVPSYTFVATANAVEYTGATPVFVDIDSLTFNIDTKKLRGILEERKDIRAVIPVHLFGLCADMPAIIEMTSQRGIAVIEDAACALGSTIDGKHAGMFGDCGAFSCHPRKSVTTGEGGMVITDSEAVAKAVHAYRDFGFTVTNLERHQKGTTIMPSVDVLGYNYRMTDIQATMGVEQMKKFPWVVSERIRRAHIYDQELKMVPWLATPFVPEGYKHTYQSYALWVGEWNGSVKDIEHWGEVRDKVMAELAEKGIATRQGTHAVHMLGYYAKKYGIKPEDYPNTMAADKMTLTIPLYPQMTDDEQQYVVDALKDFGL